MATYLFLQQMFLEHPGTTKDAKDSLVPTVPTVIKIRLQWGTQIINTISEIISNQDNNYLKKEIWDGLWENILGRLNVDWRVSEGFQEKGIFKTV